MLFRSKRYTKVLRQNLQPIPDDLPFKDYLKLVENDPTLDPFDTFEMIGPVGGAAPKAPSARATPAPGATAPPAGSASGTR